MLSYSPLAAFGAGLVLVLIPIVTTYPGIEVPPWAGLILALASAAAAYLLKSMAPASDVHRDSELPPSITDDLTDEQVALLQEEAARLKRVRPLRQQQQQREGA